MVKPPHGNPAVIAPGKVFISGEYSVLVGGWATVATLRVYARASVTPARHMTDDAFVGAILGKLSRRDRTVLERRGLRISLDVSPFYSGRAKMGIGSSAAGVSAVAGLVEVLNRGKVGRRDVLARRCAGLHRELQEGLGSGADAAASCRGGAIRFRMPTTLRPFRLPRWLHLVAVVLGAGGRTASVLRRYVDLLSRKDAATRLTTDVFGEAADRILDGIEREDWHSLRLGVNVNAAAYGELSGLLDVELITPQDEHVMRTARRMGGVSRPSGAGGGDLHMAYFPEREASEKFVRWAGARGYRVFPVDPDRGGVRLDTGKPTG
jgi:phosphomevalonate kinase